MDFGRLQEMRQRRFDRDPRADQIDVNDGFESIER